jgi:hypothetical protein
LPMIAKVLVPEVGNFVALIHLYQSANIPQKHCMGFRMHTAASNCLSPGNQALVTCKFF